MGRRKKSVPRTLAVIVQDKSGSMQTTREATISGFNEYKNTLKQEADGEVLLTLIQFDTAVLRVHSGVPLADVPDLNHDTYAPSGLTALYDAVGQAVRDTEKVARKNDRVLVVIMTDGAENSSREWHREGVLKLLEDKRAADWEFAFLGAGEQAWSTGHSLGFNSSNSIVYRNYSTQTASAYAAMATSTADITRGQTLRSSLASNTLKTTLEADAGTTLGETIPEPTSSS